MRTRLTAEELKAFVAHLSPRHSKVVATLRRLIHRAAPNAAETVLWDSLSYHRHTFGGRIKGAVCLITPRLDCVHLGFIHGAAIADPDHLLRGACKAKRFVPIRDVRDIDGQALSRLVKAAGEYDPRKLASKQVQRTRPSHSGCNRTLSWTGSRWALTMVPGNGE